MGETEKTVHPFLEKVLGKGRGVEYQKKGKR